MLVYLMMELEEKFGSELSPDDFCDYPTVSDLSRYLAERLATRSAGWTRGNQDRNLKGAPIPEPTFYSSQRAKLPDLLTNR
jgi:Phosphopantetheine attachment site